MIFCLLYCRLSYYVGARIWCRRDYICLLKTVLVYSLCLFSCVHVLSLLDSFVWHGWSSFLIYLQLNILLEALLNIRTQQCLKWYSRARSTSYLLSWLSVPLIRFFIPTTRLATGLTQHRKPNLWYLSARACVWRGAGCCTQQNGGKKNVCAYHVMPWASRCHGLTHYSTVESAMDCLVYKIYDW